MKQHFRMFAAYNRWANQRLYAAAAELDDEEYRRDMRAFFSSLHGTLNHLLVTDRIWLHRFTGQGDAPKALDAIVHDRLDDLRAARVAEDARIIDWINSLESADIAGRFTYTTVSDMRTISQRLAPALAHLFNHQTHHRGQAHGILTALGRSAPTFDLIQFQRTEEGRPYS
ncbi:DinB family protein [Phyllobacterium endophyticum]|uniref:Damage-inducible protein DinB n=1 Tax=Phyllobacterium endophyticum TaxID=1149773 RepID=A0A2P7AWK1_9HYPH|nr:DinB family protein [Phyllobacterium endophyticum]MBB3235214.1 putative damage-inducible protein DinB [Phyllobacterium endophyticum]PSH58589.1 damage-inducible protein DinB [Phyllobacterium endophyticum]TXR49051.1 damage-inducible protein DinB [Phyllobacterium endophyticum]TYR39273.1 damage-inducible protein DinB [Phyllobacterium endophyticum]